MHQSFASRLSICLALAALASACQRPASDGAAFSPVSLIHQWGEVEVTDTTPPPELPPSTEVRFDGDGTETTWLAIEGVEDLREEEGLLLGRASTDAPILAFDFAEPQGIDDELWSVELRLRTSAGTRLAVHPVLEPGPPMEAVKARIDAWPISSPIAEASEEKIQNFSVVLDRVFLFEMPPAQRSIKRVLVRPSNVAGAEFAIESLRLVFRKERLATIDSGPGWHGLGEVFREALVSRAPEALSFAVELPARPWLDLAVGTLDETSPAFSVDVEHDGDVETLAELRADGAESWKMARVDLGRWAGQRVKLRLRATGEAGQLAFWGSPTLRSAAGFPSERPQTVVLFLADTLRADHLDAWGYGRETAPTLTRLANEGTRFENAVAQATWTKVSVSSILTSLYPSTTGVVGLHDRISAGETTLAEAFREAGYATFATSSVPFSGQLTNLHQGVEVMHEIGALRNITTEGYQSKTARPWVDAYLEWLELHQDVPTFALIHAMDPHSPFEPEEPFNTMWATAEGTERFAAQSEQVSPHIKSPLLKRFMAPTREELKLAGVDEHSFVAHEKDWYDGSIRGLDAQLERLVGQLGTLGLEDRALLAFVADHGEEFLEHGQHWHGQGVYGEVANVPLAFWGQGVPQGVVIDDVVQTIDLMPTLLDLAGIGIPTRAQGRSLRPLAKGEDPRPLPAFTEHPDSGEEGEEGSYAIVEADWKLVWYPEGDRKELYKRSEDPLDQNDLAEAHADEVARLKTELDRFLAWAPNQRLDDLTVESEMSAEELEQLRSLGYVE